MPSREAIDHINKLLGVKLFKTQQAVVYDTHPIIQVKGGWRAGKSFCAADFLITRYWLGERFAIIGADYELCREEFRYLLEFGSKLGIVKDSHFPSRDQCILALSRGGGVKPCIIETKSAKYPERIAAVPYDGALLVEAAQLPFDIFEITQGRLSEKDGWMLMGGTLESEADWYVDKSREYEIPGNVDRGVTYSLAAWENTGAFEGSWDDPRLVRQRELLGLVKFMERYGGVIRPLKGLVLSEFKSTMHTGNYPYNPELPVYIWVDPGRHPSAYACLFVQILNDEVYIFDEIYVQFYNTPQVIQMVLAKPFYSKIVGGAIDISAKQKGEEKKVIWEVWKEDAKLSLDMNKIHVKSGIERISPFFVPHPIHGSVRIHIDKKCVGLISELGGCKSPFAGEGRGAWKKKMDRMGNVQSDEPSERNCDACKALIYGIVAHFGLGPKRKQSSMDYLT